MIKMSIEDLKKALFENENTVSNAYETTTPAPTSTIPSEQTTNDSAFASMSNTDIGSLQAVMKDTKEENKITCTIKRIFKNCPKPDGWYGMFASVRNQNDIRLSGVTDLKLCENMQIEVIVEEDIKCSQPDQKAYIWKRISVVTKTKTGIVNYLRSLPGVSYDVAKKIVAEFGDKTIEKIENDIDSVKKKCKLTQKQTDAIKKGVATANIYNTIQKELPELTRNQIDYCIDKLTIKPADLLSEIKQNPYLLCRIPSVSFKTADAIAIRLGLDRLSDKRIAYGTDYIINQNKDDLYVNLSNDREFYKLYKDLTNLLATPDLDSMSYCNKLMSISNDSKLPVTLNKYKNETHLYKRSVLGAVNTIAFEMKRSSSLKHSVNDINDQISAYERDTGITLNSEQRNAVKTALTEPISIITGGPGRGKTLTIDFIASIWSSLNSRKQNVYLLAPTGKAASKLNDMTGHKFSQTCMTIDKLLCKITMQKLTKKTDIKLKADTLVIVDESSMLDVIKAADLLSTCEQTNICFVGDSDQLPPIDIGNFFKDIINSNVIPTTRLITPVRNSGTILMNAEKINNNDPNLLYNFTDMPLMPYQSEDQTMQDAVIDQYFDEINKIPNKDRNQMALLCPMKKGFAGAIRLNIAIQNKVIPLNKNAKMVYDQRRGRNVYNTKGYEIPNHLYGNKDAYTRFRIGDTVINTENNNYVDVIRYSNDDYFNGTPIEKDMGITNGDCGIIKEFVPGTSDDHEYIVIQLFDGRFIELDCNEGEFDKFDLGYALTVHKAQGSEYHTVIYVSPASMKNLTHIGFANKNIVYTAVTRAQKRVVVIGSKDALEASILTSIKNGNTTIPELLRN